MSDLTLYRPNQQSKFISILMFSIGSLFALFSFICYITQSAESFRSGILYIISFTVLCWIFSLYSLHTYSMVIAFDHSKIRVYKSEVQEYLWCDFSNAYFCPNIHAHEYLVLSVKPLSKKQVRRIVNTSLGVSHSDGLVFYVKKDVRDNLKQIIDDNQVNMHTFKGTFQHQNSSKKVQSYPSYVFSFNRRVSCGFLFLKIFYFLPFCP